MGDLGSSSSLGRSPGEGHGYAFQYSCLEKSMDRGVWPATVHGIVKSWKNREGMMKCSWVREIKAANGANDYWDVWLKLYILKRVTPFEGVCKSYAIWKNVFSLNTKHCRKIARGINTPISVSPPSLILLFIPPFGSIQAETRVRESWTDAVGRVWCNMFWLTVP